MNIIDSHAHIYPDAIANKATRSIGNFYELPMGCNGTVDTLLVEGELAGIEKYLVHSAAVTWERVASINDFISHSVDAHPDKFIGFGTMHPQHPQMEKELDRMKSLGLKGVKLHPDFQHFYLDEEKSIHMFKEMATRNLPALVHTGDKRYPYSSPERMALLLDKVPSVRVVCAHLGGWSVWEEAYKVLAGRRNVWIDTSSSLYAIDAEKAVRIIRAFGVDRTFFGTDYPMWNPGEELERFNALPLTDDEKRMILGDNLIAFMGKQFHPEK